MNLVFGDEEIEKNTFHEYKQTIDINMVDINKIVISDEDSYGNNGSFTYIIGYKSNDGIRLSYINLLRMTGYVKYFNNSGKKCLLWLKIIN